MVLIKPVLEVPKYCYRPLPHINVSHRKMQILSIIAIDGGREGEEEREREREREREGEREREEGSTRVGTHMNNKVHYCSLRCASHKSQSTICSALKTAHTLGFNNYSLHAYIPTSHMHTCSVWCRTKKEAGEANEAVIKCFHVFVTFSVLVPDSKRLYDLRWQLKSPFGHFLQRKIVECCNRQPLMDGWLRSACSCEFGIRNNQWQNEIDRREEERVTMHIPVLSLSSAALSLSSSCSSYLKPYINFTYMLSLSLSLSLSPLPHAYLFWSSAANFSACSRTSLNFLSLFFYRKTKHQLIIAWFHMLTTSLQSNNFTLSSCRFLHANIVLTLTQ